MSPAIVETQRGPGLSRPEQVPVLTGAFLAVEQSSIPQADDQGNLHYPLRRAQRQRGSVQGRALRFRELIPAWGT